MKSISCIVPVYNLDYGHNWERFCSLIESLARAGRIFIPNYYEVIIVNDDPLSKKSTEIMSLLSDVGMRECSKMLSNSHNMGQAYSRNRGGDEASSEYLHFIDQDDYVNESFYETLSGDSEKDFYIASPVFFLEGSSKEISAIPFITRIMYQRASHLDNLWPLLFSNIAYSPGQVIIKKTKFIASGRFPILINRGSDDYALFYNLTMHNHLTTAYMKTAVFYYRIHTDQNNRILNMNNSIDEFFASTITVSLSERIIKKLKISALWRPFSKLAYIFFFRRVYRRDMK